MKVDFDGTPGDYTYSSSTLGKSASGVVANGSQSERNQMAQLSAGGSYREPGDHGGHLIADRFGGRNDASNIDAQAANVNQKDQGAVEREVARLASDPSNTVYLGVQNCNRAGIDRPDATIMTVGVQDNTSGKIEIETHSFTNAPHSEQEVWNDIALATDPIDPRQDTGLVGEQRNIANELVGEEDFIDHSLNTGWTYIHYDVNDGVYEPGTISQNTSSNYGEESSDGNPIIYNGVDRFDGNPIVYNGVDRFDENPIVYNGVDRFDGNPIIYSGVDRFDGNPIISNGIDRLDGNQAINSETDMSQGGLMASTDLGLETGFVTIDIGIDSDSGSIVNGGTECGMSDGMDSGLAEGIDDGFDGGIE